MRQALIILVALCGNALATPSDELDAARAEYRNGRYSRALPLFNALVYPEARLASQDDQVDTFVALGVCRYETGDHPGATREWMKALTIDANTRIDPLIVSDPAAIKDFNETKIEMQRRAEAEADARHRAELRKLKASYVGFQSHQFVLNFAPFGVGQFQNGDASRGTFFLVSEGVTLVTSASIWAYLVNTYGIRSTHVPLSDGPNVRFLQQIEIGSGALFFGLCVYGAIDSLRHYKPAVRGEVDESLLPPELRDLDKPKKPQPKAKPTSLLDHLTPMVTPSGVGIGLAWEQ